MMSVVSGVDGGGVLAQPAVGNADGRAARAARRPVCTSGSGGSGGYRHPAAETYALRW